MSHPPDDDRVALGRRVLVVEDEFLAALTTVDFLESIGCEVVGPAARLATALEFARSEPLDAAVLDINIAGEMIWPVAEQLRYRGVPCLFLSAYPGKNIVPAIFAAAPYLPKPLEPDHLARHLAMMWRASDAPVAGHAAVREIIKP
jgi:DNA-binding response OmpR family regulator